MLKNEMEQLVQEQLTQMLMENDDYSAAVCRCERCLAQIKVVALNRLPPVYRPENEPADWQTMKEEYRVRVAEVVGQAIAQVSKTAHQNDGQPQAGAVQSLTGLYGRRGK